MSGHSKWATIKHQKGVADAKRGQLFTKLARAITIAVKEGNGITDPNSNFKLRLAADRARVSNMPKENIERAIQRGKGTGDAQAFTEARYEGFAPGGVAVIIEAVTDNKQRTFSEVKNILEKSGGRMGEQGSVAYLFEQKGSILLKKNDKSVDDILSVGLENGVEDVDLEDGVVTLYTSVQRFSKAKKRFEELGFSIEDAAISYIPSAYIIIADKALEEKILSLFEKLEELDDVQEVYSNLGESE